MATHWTARFLIGCGSAGASRQDLRRAGRMAASPQRRCAQTSQSLGIEGALHRYFRTEKRVGNVVKHCRSARVIDFRKYRQVCTRLLTDKFFVPIGPLGSGSALSETCRRRWVHGSACSLAGASRQDPPSLDIRRIHPTPQMVS